MLDLHAGIHLDEIEALIFIEKLQCASPSVAHILAGLYAGFGNCRAHFIRNPRSRRFLDDFLMPALQ